MSLRLRSFLMIAALSIGLASTASAVEHEVQMLNKGPDGQRNWFEPAIMMAEPGDMIRFVAVDKGHNSQSVVVPEGALEWKGKINEELIITVDSPGVYAYKCTPHFGLGMIGFVVVGNPSVNIEAVEETRYPGKSKRMAAELIEEIKASSAS